MSKFLKSSEDFDEIKRLDWFFLGVLFYGLRYLFFYLSLNTLRIYIEKWYPICALVFICFSIFYFKVVYRIYDNGPIVDYYEMGRCIKTAMVVISSCAALISRLLLENIYYSYMLVTVIAELQAYFQLLYHPRDHSFWDVFFIASLQIIIINLKDGNILVLILALLLILKLLFEKFRSYSTPITTELILVLSQNV
ncbi:hypothetical protein MANES_07G135850v8 [Manihot esculenta]|uniref:Uncharacterized protein n=1 Tax=Manihot esculenta TaxID=3983 RepID=A0ACB7HHS9_MANES|nr:hypothetical protein MANES_07G135850v8 [Manihot esculenta]